jgi:hypothetical protein
MPAVNAWWVTMQNKTFTAPELIVGVLLGIGVLLVIRGVVRWVERKH